MISSVITLLSYIYYYFFAVFFTDSKFLSDTKWLTSTFEEGYRKQNILITDDDVLRPEVLQKVNFALYKSL